MTANAEALRMFRCKTIDNIQCNIKKIRPDYTEGVFCLGIYLKEVCRLTGCEGEKILSLLIEQSFRKLSVFFEVRENNGQYTLYWNYEVMPEEFIPVLRKYAEDNMLEKVTLLQLLEDEGAMNEVSKLCKTYSCILDPDEIGIVNLFAENGLPEIDRRKPRGLDGHSYELNCYALEKEFKCWCVLPKEWKELEKLIELFVQKAGLDKKYLSYGVV